MPLFGAQTAAFDETAAIIAERKPALADEFRALRSRPFHETREFLEVNFPVQYGWGNRLVHKMPHDVANWLNAHQ